MLEEDCINGLFSFIFNIFIALPDTELWGIPKSWISFRPW